MILTIEREIGSAACSIISQNGTTTAGAYSLRFGTLCQVALLKNDVTLAQMKIFVAVGETRTYTEAAGALGLPISKVSRTIKAIEAASHLRLVRRTEGSVTLSEAGVAYLASCRRVVTAAQVSSDVLSSHRSNVEGVLRVGVPPTFARYVLVPLMPQFNLLHPELRLEFILYTSGWDRLPAAEHDLLIKLKMPKESSRETQLHLKLFPPIRQGLFASPAYLARREPIKSLASLTAHQCIGYSNSGELNIWSGQESGKHVEVHPSHDIVVSDAEMQLAMAHDGMGVALLPFWLTHASVASEKLARVLPNFEADSILFNVVHSGKSRITAKERALLSFLDTIVATQLDPRVQGQTPSAFFQMKG